jgi:hypothetical protein
MCYRKKVILQCFCLQIHACLGDSGRDGVVLITILLQPTLNLPLFQCLIFLDEGIAFIMAAEKEL